MGRTISSSSDALQAAKERAASHVFALSADLLGSTSRGGCFTALNPAWEKTLGFSCETLMGRPFIEFVHPADRDGTAAEITRLGAGGAESGGFETRFAVKTGGWRWLSWRVEVTAEGFYFVARDVTARVAADQRAHLLANIVEGVDDAIMTKTVDGVVTSWNRASEDLYGFSADEAIGRSMVDLIVPPERSGEPKAIVARLLGGDGVRQYTTERRHKDGTELTVSLTASLMRDAEYRVLGVAVVSRDVAQEHADDLPARSEVDTLVWVGRLRDAIDEGRVVFYAQPIVSLHGGETSYELLCRMLDRGGDVLPPAVFLPAAENYGLIEELDLIAVDEAALQIARGHRVSINLSTASVGRWHIVDLIAEKLHRAGANPACLTIEITETALMKNIVNAQRFATGIAALGCRVALDDFGTGFGGFTYLKKLKIDQLKIDVEFVRDLQSSRTSQHVVKAVVSLAQGLGLQTVAEGVEDEETLGLVAGHGVTHAQGYFFARPGPIEEVLLEHAVHAAVDSR
jgi:PAS domain S-box-containing protein